MLAFATLCKKRKKYSLDSYCMAVPALGFAAWLVQELVRVSSWTYCGCLRTFFASIMNGDYPQAM